MANVSVARPKPSETCWMAIAPRHTPLGAPVVPEVKVTFAVPRGNSTRLAGSRSKTSPCPATSTGSNRAFGHRAANSAGANSASTPAACTAWVICSVVKNVGSGTCTTWAAAAARSATTQAGELSISVANAPLRAPFRRTLNFCTS